MKFLIIGLGSMGKRRIRNLQAIKAGTILGVDLRDDRREEVEKMYAITTIKNLKDVHADSIDAVIVSTPPDKHTFGIQYALECRKPVFVEASVVIDGLDTLNAIAKKNKVLVCPSCTLRFHPAVKTIKALVNRKIYGSITNYSYHMGQYLPDWHPWEKLSDSYTSKRETGGAREMVAFDLTWLIDIVGYPKGIRGYFGRTMDMGIDIDDTYTLALKHTRSYGMFMADVVSRYATRRLILNMERGQILWSWDEPYVRIYNAQNQSWAKKNIRQGKAQSGYNKNIIEDMYIQEMKAFISAVKCKAMFPNTLSDDINILKLLNCIEKE